MTKEEKIKEAWGVDYHENINSDGWFNIFATNINLELCDVIGESCRPKSIQGIENNNGWIKIESEDDLRYCDFEDLWVFINDKVKLYSEVVRLRNLESGYFETDITYYQPIFKPKPPIY